MDKGFDGGGRGPDSGAFPQDAGDRGSGSQDHGALATTSEHAAPSYGGTPSYPSPWDYDQPLRYDESYPVYEFTGYELPSDNGPGYDLSKIIGTGPLPSFGNDEPNLARLSYDDPRFDETRLDNLRSDCDGSSPQVAGRDTGVGSAAESRAPSVSTQRSGGTLLDHAPRDKSRGGHKKAGARSAKGSLQDRLDALAKSMRASARLVEEISAELEAKAVTAKQLHEDAKRAEALAAIHKDGAEAIRRTLDAGLARSEQHIRRDSIIIAIGSFFAGGIVSLLVTLLVHPL